MAGADSLDRLNVMVVTCRRCPRLVEYRENLPSKKAYEGQVYWRRPVPGFGDIRAKIVMVGLAPAAHGGERTGRVFTGDESARFLFRALYEIGLANKPTSESREDGLILNECYITAAVKCVPPGDKPTAEEFRNCSDFLESELALLKDARAYVALGKMAFDAVVRWAGTQGLDADGAVFRHGASYRLGRRLKLFACYHPSPGNTRTGTLTPKMMKAIFGKVIKECITHPEQ